MATISQGDESGNLRYMWQRLSQLTIAKPTAITLILVLAVMPWFQGGRDPVGWMVMIGVALIGSFILWRSPGSQNLGRLGAVWLAFVAWTGLSIIWTANRYQSVLEFLLVSLVGLIAILAASLRENRLAQWVFERSYLIIASITSLVGIYIFVVQSYERATSTFYLPNPLAGFLLPVVMVGLWRFAERYRLWEGLLAMLNLAVFILTDSRGATTALVVAVFIGLWLSQNIIRHWRRLLIVVAGALALATIINLGRGTVTHHIAFQGQRYQQVLSGDSSSSSDRAYYLKSAISIWAAQPLWGSGAGTFGTMHPKYQYRIISAGSSVHNYYVQTLSELGLVGISLLLLVLLELLRGVLRGLKQDPAKLPYALGLLALLLHAGVDIDAMYPVLWCLAAILVGLLYLPNTQKRRLLGSTAGLALITSLILAAPVIWLFQNQTHAQNASDLQALGEYTKAADYYRLARSHAPYDPDWLGAEGINDLALALDGTDRTKNLDQAATLGFEAERLDPQDGQHDLLLGRVRYNQHLYDEATVAYRSAIKKDPYNHPEYYNDLASVYIQQNKLVAATDALNVIINGYTPTVIANRNYDSSIKSNVATSYALAAEVALAQNDTEKARSRLEQGLKIDDSNLIIHVLLQRIGA